MKIRTKLITLLVTIGLLCAAVAVSGSRITLADQSARRSFSTGMVSLAPGQALAAHVVNTGDENGFHWGVKVVDSAGNILALYDQTHVAFREAARIEFMPRDLAAGERLPIRVAMLLTDFSAGDNHRIPNDGDALMSVEIFNVNNGQTTFCTNNLYGTGIY